MLELRPICENCGKSLPPESKDAMICSYECTFCRHCADIELENVCPNCGGGFCERPVRPKNNWKGGNFLGNHPPTSKVLHKPVDLDNHREFAKNITNIDPEKR